MKVLTAITLIDEGGGGYSGVKITLGDSNDFNGNLVMRQGDDTIVVRAEEAVAFVEALTRFVKGGGDG